MSNPVTPTYFFGLDAKTDTELHRQEFIRQLVEVRARLDEPTTAYCAGAWRGFVAPFLAWVDQHGLLAEEDRGATSPLSVIARDVRRTKEAIDVVGIPHSLFRRLLDGAIAAAAAMAFEPSLALDAATVETTYAALCDFVASQLRDGIQPRDAHDTPLLARRDAVVARLGGRSPDAYLQFFVLLHDLEKAELAPPQELADLDAVLKSYALVVAGEMPTPLDCGIRPWMVARCERLLTKIENGFLHHTRL